MQKTKIIHKATTYNRFGTGDLIRVLAGILCTVICLTTTVKEGLEQLYLLPAAFTVCSLFFSRAFTYWKDNVAFIVLYASVYIRYLATPVLMTITNYALETVYPEASYYQQAIYIQIFELIALLLIIDKVWTKYKRQKQQMIITIPKDREVRFDVSLFGFAFLAGIAFLVFTRGHLDSVLSHYSTWWYISEETSDIYIYDLMSVDIVKNVVSIIVVAFFAHQYHRTSSKFDKLVYFFLAFVVSISMTMFYIYTQRTALAQLIISVAAMMIAFFPDKKKLLLGFFGVGGTFFVMYIFATGSMGYETGGSNDGMLAELTKMAELYVSGPSMVAVTQSELGWVQAHMTSQTWLSDVINTTHIFGLFPFLRGILNLVSDIPTTNQLFVYSLDGLTYILPNYTFWTYYGGVAFGWLLEILSMYLVIKAICLVDKIKNKNNDACYYYALAYVETLLGQAVFVNNTFLLWHAFTNIPFWLLAFSYVNRLGNRVRFR